MAPILSINYDEYSSSDSLFTKSFIEEMKSWVPISTFMVEKTRIVSGLLMPIIIHNILKRETNYTITNLFNKLFIIPETLDYTYTRLAKWNNNTLDVMGILKRYYSDSIRWYFLSNNIEDEFIYNQSDLSFIDLYVKRLEQRLLKVEDFDSLRMDYHFREFVDKCKNYLLKRDITSYINYLKSFTDIYVFKEMFNLSQLKLYLIAIYPLMPFLAEEIYEEKFSKKSSIINEGWLS